MLVGYLCTRTTSNWAGLSCVFFIVIATHLARWLYQSYLLALASVVFTSMIVGEGNLNRASVTNHARVTQTDHSVMTVESK